MQNNMIPYIILLGTFTFPVHGNVFNYRAMGKDITEQETVLVNEVFKNIPQAERGCDMILVSSMLPSLHREGDITASTPPDYT